MRAIVSTIIILFIFTNCNDENTYGPDDDTCKRVVKQLKNVTLYGSFAHDLGCSLEIVKVRRRKGKFKEMTPKGLKANGWKDESKRNELALNWVKYVYLGFESSPASDNKDFQKVDTPKFTTPQVITLKDGGRSVGLWVQEPAGMNPENSYHYLMMDFDNNGNISKIDRNQGFTVVIDGYE